MLIISSFQNGKILSSAYTFNNTKPSDENPGAFLIYMTFLQDYEEINKSALFETPIFCLSEALIVAYLSKMSKQRNNAENLHSIITSQVEILGFFFLSMHFFSKAALKTKDSFDIFTSTINNLSSFRDMLRSLAERQKKYRRIIK